MSETKNLVTKLAEVMGEIKYVEKRGTNEAQHYKFVRAADLANIVRQKLAKRNVLMLSNVVKAERYQIPTKDPQRPMPAVDLTVLYTFHDGDTGESLSFHGYGTGADQGDKAANKAQTAALKYALRNSFLVPDEKGDPEADKALDRVTAQDTMLRINGYVESEEMKGERFWWKVADQSDKSKSWAVYTPEDTQIVITDLQGKVGNLVELLCFEEAAGKKKVYRLARVSASFSPEETKQPF